MEFIRRQLAQIREQLANLSLSQKLLFVMIVLAIGGSFLWMIYLTAKPETVVLIDQNLSPTEVARVQNLLDQRDTYYKVEGGKIYVKRQDQDRLLAQLQMNRALPSDMTEGWKKLILDADMWLPQEDRQNRWQLAKEQRLAQIIGYMDGVTQANVIINAGSKRLLSDGPSSDPSASVSIQMEAGNKPNKALVTAIADLLSGSVDRLTRDRVRIIADGASFSAPGENSAFSGDLLDNRQAHERYFAQKIEQALGINKALVAVFVDLDTKSVHTEVKKYGEPPLMKERASEDSSEQKNPSGEPGVRPNTGGSVAVAEGTAGEKSTKTETENEYGTERDLTHTVEQNVPFTVKSIRATVNLPYSYFADIYKQQTGKTEAPKETDLAPIIKTETQSIQAKILPILGPAGDPSAVVVSRYYDLPTAEPMTILASRGPLSTAQLPQMIKIGGLVLLAFGSLLMVLLMLRKASANVGIPIMERTVNAPEVGPLLEADAGPVGEAGSTEGVLEGIEVDGATLRTRKMAEQVATMVKEDPASAAALVRQWIIKDQ